MNTEVLMQTSYIFAGIVEEELSRMLHCFEAQKVKFQKGQTIMTYTDNIQKVGVILSGKAHLYCIDYNGTFTLLEQLNADELFGELFALPLNNLEYIVEADSNCEVLFIRYSRIITPCSNTCHHHTQLIDNLFHLSTKKNQQLSLRVNLLTSKSTRLKLMNYFSYIQNKTGQNPFKLDMSLTDLADYLCVDRSSMMREMRALKEEGVLDSKGRTITLLEG